MRNIQLVVLLVTIFVSIISRAEQIQLTNGDTLNVKIIKYSDTTITFFHPVLGELTIDKTEVCNLSDLMQEQRNNETECKMLANKDMDEKTIAIASNQVVEAKTSVDAAMQHLENARKYAQTADAKDQEAAGEAVKAAEAALNAANKALISAVDDYDSVVDKIKMEGNVNAAQAKLAEAQEKLNLAKEKLSLAKEETKEIESELSIAKESEEKNLQAGVAFLEKKLKQAEKQVSISEDEVDVAEKEVETAEDGVKLAKGEKVADGFLGTGWFKGWDSSFEIGLRGADGASVNSNFRVAFNTHYENDKHRWDFKSFYLFASENHITNQDRLNAFLVKDWLFPETKWFAFSSAMFDWDQFRDWKYRLLLSAGPGYQFIKTESLDFSGQIGGTANLEFDKLVADPNSVSGYTKKDTVGFEALLGVNLTWDITSEQQFTFTNNFYPSLTSFGDYRNLTTMSWSHHIDWFEGLALKFGIRNEYDTTQEIKNDFNYYFSFLWGF